MHTWRRNLQETIRRCTPACPVSAKLLRRAKPMSWQRLDKKNSLAAIGGGGERERERGSSRGIAATAFISFPFSLQECRFCLGQGTATAAPSSSSLLSQPEGSCPSCSTSLNEEKEQAGKKGFKWFFTVHCIFKYLFYFFTQNGIALDQCYR